MDLHQLSIAQLQEAFRTGEATPADAVRALHERASSIDGDICGYLSLQLEPALAAAERADVSLPLGGVPIAIKDNMNSQGEPCTCASRMLRKYTAPYDATVISRLKAAGAIPFGRTNLDEFAMGSSTENSSVAPTRNPWDLSRAPGGSSGGSAAVVAADEAFAALGSDTGGSIRQPAAFCGCVGLKPTYGRVSRFGLVAFASSLDQIGPMTKTVRDAALLLNVIAGKDPLDSTSVETPAPDFTSQLGRDLKGVRLGMPKEYFVEGIDPAVERAVRDALRHFESLGAEVVEVSMPHTQYAVGVYYIIATAEASTNLARFDGVRYGHRAAGADNVQALYGLTREEGFGPEVKRRIVLGTYALSSGYYDAYYLRAQKVRTLIQRDFTEAFEKVDALVCPTTPEPAFKLGDRADDPLRMYLADICTIAANLAGNCGLSLTCGFAEQDGSHLPIGLQLLGKPFDESNLLKIAHAYEQSTEWRLRRPPLMRSAL